jgi:hypothetical protein
MKNVHVPVCTVLFTLFFIGCEEVSRETHLEAEKGFGRLANVEPSACFAYVWYGKFGTLHGMLIPDQNMNDIHKDVSNGGVVNYLMKVNDMEEESCISIIFEKDGIVSLEPNENPKGKACKYFTRSEYYNSIFKKTDCKTSIRKPF